ncbi:MAG: hypothetical protein J6Q54_00020 [Oscillospiraceae bacterium]|nr:hypothetical protein [Oscillospiraceae bacterium]
MATKKKHTAKKLPSWTPYLITGLFALGIILLVIFGNMAGPASSVKNAASNTLFADNFTTSFQFQINNEACDGILNAAVDRDARDLQFYLQFQTNESDYICGIYNKTFALCNVSTNDLETQKAEEQVNAFFDALDAGKEPDWSLILDFGDFNLQEAISEDFDFPVFMECLKNFLNQLDDTDWAESYAGYEKSKEEGVTYHTFQPELHSLLVEITPDFQAAFKDPARYDALVEYTDNAMHLLNAGKAELRFGVKGRRLVSATMDIRYHNTSIQGDFQFIGINSTTVDYDTIAYYIDEAGKTPEERFEGLMDPVLPLS